MTEAAEATIDVKKKLITPPFRGSYVNLAKARAIKGGNPRYSILMALDEDHPFIKSMRKMETAVAIEKWGKLPKKLKSALKTDADRDDEDDQFAGKVTVNFASADAPECVFKDESGDMVEVIDSKMLYSGAWYRVSTRAYAWEHETGGRGVSWSLNNVLWVKDDKPFSGRATASQDFSNLEDDDDDDMLD